MTVGRVSWSSGVTGGGTLPALLMRLLDRGSTPADNPEVTPEAAMALGIGSMDKTPAGAAVAAGGGGEGVRDYLGGDVAAAQEMIKALSPPAPPVPTSKPQGAFSSGGKVKSKKGCKPAFSSGGKVVGPGDGRSDSVPMPMDDGGQAALSDGEYVIPAYAVSALGKGSTEAGAKMLDDMVGSIKADWSEDVGAFPMPKAGGRAKGLGGIFKPKEASAEIQLTGAGNVANTTIAGLIKGLGKRGKDGKSDVADFTGDQTSYFDRARDFATGDPTGYDARTGLTQQQYQETIGGLDGVNAQLGTQYGALDQQQGRVGMAQDQLASTIANGGGEDALIGATLNSFDNKAAIDTEARNRQRQARGAFGARRDVAESTEMADRERERALIEAQLRTQGVDRKNAAALGIGNLASTSGNLTGQASGVAGQQGSLLTSRSNVAGSAANLAGQQRNAAAGDLDVLRGIGQQQQDQEQKRLDQPFRRLDAFGRVLNGAPSTTVQQAGQPSALQQGVGIAGALGGLASGFFADGGKVEDSEPEPDDNAPPPKPAFSAEDLVRILQLPPEPVKKADGGAMEIDTTAPRYIQNIIRNKNEAAAAAPQAQPMAAKGAFGAAEADGMQAPGLGRMPLGVTEPAFADGGSIESVLSQLAESSLANPRRGKISDLVLRPGDMERIGKISPVNPVIRPGDMERYKKLQPILAGGETTESSPPFSRDGLEPLDQALARFNAAQAGRRTFPEIMSPGAALEAMPKAKARPSADFLATLRAKMQGDAGLADAQAADLRGSPEPAFPAPGFARKYVGMKQPLSETIGDAIGLNYRGPDADAAGGRPNAIEMRAMRERAAPAAPAKPGSLVERVKEAIGQGAPVPASKPSVPAESLARRAPMQAPPVPASKPGGFDAMLADLADKAPAARKPMPAFMPESLTRAPEPAAESAAVAQGAFPPPAAADTRSFGDKLGDGFANPLTQFGLALLASQNTNLGGAIGEAGLKTANYVQGQKAQKRAEQREARADGREDRLETRDNARLELEAKKLGLTEQQTQALMALREQQAAARQADIDIDNQRADKALGVRMSEADAMRAYRQAQLGQGNTRLEIARQNLARLTEQGKAEGAAKAKTDPVTKAQLDAFATAAAEARIAGDMEEADRIDGLIAELNGPPEGFLLEGGDAGDEIGLKSGGMVKGAFGRKPKKKPKRGAFGKAA